MKISDEDLIKALKRAGVPTIYRSKESTLLSYGEYGAKLKSFVDNKGYKLASGELIQLVSGSLSDKLDCFYLFVRGLILNSHGVCIINLLDLMSFSMDQLNDLQQFRVLAIEGMTPSNYDYYNSKKDLLEWRMTKWIQDGRGLILQCDTELQSVDLWSDRFKNIIRSKETYAQ